MFANVLGYHAKYYMALAYMQLAEGQVAFTNEKAKECGKCVTMLKTTVAKFEEARPFVNALGGAYKANFDKTYGEAVALRDKMNQENKTVYYDNEPSVEDCPKPDPTNYVKTISMADVLNANSPIDEKLRHLVPPAVRQMQDELSKVLQGLVQEQFTKIQTCNDQLQNFLKQLGLPMSIQTLGAKREIPDELWAKIEEFQKKGGDQNFAQSIQGN